jgi:hypothetical protein
LTAVVVNPYAHPAGIADDVIDPHTAQPGRVRDPRSCTRTGSGCPSARNSRLAFLKSPTSSFFLVTTEVARLARRQSGFHAGIDMIELRIPIGIISGPLGVFRFQGSCNRVAATDRGAMLCLKRCPIVCNAAARFGKLRLVRNDGAIGSPPVVGSTRLNRPTNRVGDRSPSTSCDHRLAAARGRAQPPQPLGRPVPTTRGRSCSVRDRLPESGPPPHPAVRASAAAKRRRPTLPPSTRLCSSRTEASVA